MKTLRWPLLLVLSSCIACSGNGFDVAESTPAADDAAADSSTDETSGEVGTDTAVPDAGDPVDAAGDSALDTAPPDTCVGNPCGGCTALDHVPDSTCGACGAGKWVCKGTEAVTCADPFTGIPVGTACGKCGLVKTVCASDGKTSICPTETLNACGGCKALSPALGSACGKCAGAVMVCDGEEATKCGVDPVTTPAPDTACGECGGGVYKCVGTTTTSCLDPAPFPKGTKCGDYCGASTYQCSGTTTACVKPDDRTLGTDAFYTGYATGIWTLPTNYTPVAIGFTMQRKASITAITLAMQRYDAGTVGDSLGSLEVRLLRGTSPSSTDELARVSFSPTSVPAGSPGTFVVPLTATVMLDAGTRVFVELKDNSGLHNFSLYGGAPTGPAHLGFFYQSTSSPTGWAEYTSYDPYLTLSENGCF
jgi:hypothetical protein